MMVTTRDETPAAGETYNPVRATNHGDDVFWGSRGLKHINPSLHLDVCRSCFTDH